LTELGTGYGGTYRGTVVDNTDPLLQNRLLIVVPDVNAKPVWASPSLADHPGQLPAVGDQIMVSYQGGDSDYPVWQSVAAGESAAAVGGHPGLYRATVIDNIDPVQANRLQVSVPDVPAVGDVWATRSPSSGTESVPEVGATVWVQFEGGDLNHPVWVGLA
jgi:hypothetical protein